MQLQFSKIQGLGNDYIFVDIREKNVSSLPWPDLSIRLSERHRGIGADGIIIISEAKSQDSDVAMQLYNADGSMAMTCGNGLRGVMRFLRTKKEIKVGEEVRIETLAGVSKGRVLREDLFEVEMGIFQPDARHLKALEVGVPVFGKIEGNAVNVGNPHFVIWGEDPSEDFMADLGTLLEYHEQFAPDRTNVEWVLKKGPQKLQVKVWERGSGITQACGTGACAAAMVGIFVHQMNPAGVTVELPGGDLEICWDPRTKIFTQSGPSEAVFSGGVTL